MKPEYEIHLAPLQGYTDWIYRNNFARFFGGVDACYTPFIRLETGHTFRNKDRRETALANNTVPLLIPQILPGTAEEFYALSRFVIEQGYKQVDINLGCPFPLITGKKMGAGMLSYPDRVREVLSPLNDFPEVRFSVKMRLGMENASEGLCLVDVLNRLRLDYITVHARLGRQQYKGDPDKTAFEEFYRICEHPLFYNGDVKTVEDVENIFSGFSLLRGIVMGRGLLSSPWMAAEFKENKRFSKEELKNRILGFHQALLEEYRNRLQDERLLLTKMKTVWDYLLPATDRKLLKKVRKANRINEYEEAAGRIFQEPFCERL